MFRKNEPVLLERQTAARNKFRYLSRHSWPEGENRFSFKQSRKNGYFPEMPVQIQHLGGYTTHENAVSHEPTNGENRLFVLTGHDENDPLYYTSLPFLFLYNLYEAYYESCRHAYIIEYLGNPENLEAIAGHIRQRNGTESALLQDCPESYA